MSTPALAAVGLRKTFGGVRAIDDVSFVVPDGSLTALIGPNGAGKTTLFNLMTNLFAADAGETRFYGTPLTGMTSSGIAGLGLLRTFQTARVFPGMTAIDNVLIGGHRHVRTHPLRQMLWLGGSEERAMADRAEGLLDLVGLSAFRNAPATALPMGAQKLIEVCRALMARPRMVLLDEPAAGLNDTETSDLAALLRAVRESGIAVLVVEHNMSLVMDIADQVIVLDLGKLLTMGTPDQVQRDERVIEAYLGLEQAIV